MRAERATAAQGMPEDLMALYEKLRAKNGGVGAAPCGDASARAAGSR